MIFSTKKFHCLVKVCLILGWHWLNALHHHYVYTTAQNQQMQQPSASVIKSKYGLISIIRKMYLKVSKVKILVVQNAPSRLLYYHVVDYYY